MTKKHLTRYDHQDEKEHIISSNKAHPWSGRREIPSKKADEYPLLNHFEVKKRLFVTSFSQYQLIFTPEHAVFHCRAIEKQIDLIKRIKTASPLDKTKPSA